MRLALKNNIDTSIILGSLVGLVIAYPSPPYYLFAFAALVISLSILKFKNTTFNIFYVVAIGLCIIFSIASNLKSDYKDQISLSSALMSSFFYVFFLFGFGVRDPIKFLSGYSNIMLIVSVYIIGLLLILQPFNSGLLMFVYPHLRMWGADYISDWPNFIGFGLSVSFLINWLVLKKYNWAIINIIAALVTTSRIGIMAIALIIFFKLLKNPIRFVKHLTFIGLFVLIVLIVITQFDIKVQELDQFLLRLNKKGDRELLYGFMFNDLYLNNMFLGIGSVKMSSFKMTFTTSSFHNSYLEILVRFGTITIIPYLVLIFPRNMFKIKTNKLLFDNSYLLLCAFFLVSAFFQNILKHPHYLMLYSVIIIKNKEIISYANSLNKVN